VYNVSTLSTLTGGTWTQFSSSLDLTRLPIAHILGKSVRVEFLKNGDASDVRLRHLRVVVSETTSTGIVDGERTLTVEY